MISCWTDAREEGMSRAGEFARVDGVAPVLFYVNGLEHFGEGFAVGRVSEIRPRNS